MAAKKVRQMNQHHQNLHQMMIYHPKKNVKSHVMEELSEKQDRLQTTNETTNEATELRDNENIIMMRC